MTHPFKLPTVEIAFFAVLGLAMGCQPKKEESTSTQEEPIESVVLTGERTQFIIEVEAMSDVSGQKLPVTPKALDSSISSVSKRLKSLGHEKHALKKLEGNRFTVEIPIVTAEESSQIRKGIERTAKLELKEVHKQSSSLAPRVDSGADIAPPGYKLYQFPTFDDDGKRIGQQPILLSRRNIIGGHEVQTAAASPNRYDGINVLLTENGGKRVANVTEKMRKGVDRMAIVLDGQGLIAPVVQGNLGRRFEITGLEDKEEVRQVVFALNNPLFHPLKIISEETLTDSEVKKKEPKN